jgi:hypothetical protein
MNLTRPIMFWIATCAAVIAAVVLLREILLPFVAGLVLGYLFNPECAVNLLLRHALLCPRVAHPDAVLEHEATEDILALVAAMRQHPDGTGAVDAGGDEFADYDVIAGERYGVS